MRPTTTAKVVLLAGAGTGLLLISHPASAAAPTVSAWWNGSNTATVTVPAPPDVAAGDLFVQGSNAVPTATFAAVLPLPSAAAFTGLTFTFPRSSRAKVLTLTLDPAATAPTQVSVQACRATAAFKAQHNGPAADIPSYDSTSCVTGAFTADSKGIVFAGIGTLSRPGSLSVVIVPGPLDRDVLSAPGRDALTLTSGTATTPDIASLPPAGAVAPQGPTSASTPSQPDGGAVANPVGPDGVVPRTQPGASPLAAGPAPGTAPTSSVGPGAATVDNGPLAANRQPTGVGSSRVAAALSLLGLLLFAGLGYRFGRNVPAPPGQRQAAGRGVGRFQSPRDGKAPRLT